MSRLIIVFVSLLWASVFFTGCQKKEAPAPPPEVLSEQQLDTEYRAILAEAGLYGGGAPTPPAQIGQESYGQVLILTTGHGSTEMLTRLLAARTDIGLNYKAGGRTLLHAAAATLHATNSNLLLERGLDPNAQDDHGLTPLHLVVSQADGLNLARLLLARGARVDLRDEKGMTPLLSAGPACVKLLVDKGADLAVQDTVGNTALHWAAYRKSYDTAVALIAAGALPDTRNSASKTPLHLAVENRDLKMAELLLTAGADSSTADSSGTSPRQAAEKTGNKMLMGLFAQQPDGGKAGKP